MAAATLFGAIPGSSVLLLVVFVVVLPLAVVYWLYRDAMARDVASLELWVVACAVAGAVGTVVGSLVVAGLYLLVTRR
ncbi:hypothetical protein [Halobaculum litoreum]|uniref:hypothetical protein n=1 Tax=Halobaculum litoreum TaxID=3031998 RepID=UPI0024C21E24|nr:hypothetical protein [Halobaculum sp. DT92]